MYTPWTLAALVFIYKIKRINVLLEFCQLFIHRGFVCVCFVMQSHSVAQADLGVAQAGLGVSVICPQHPKGCYSGVVPGPTIIGYFLSPECM